MSSKSPVEAGETGEAGQGEGMEGKPLPSDSGMGSTASSRSVSRTDTVSSSRVPSGREESNVESKASASGKGAFTGRSTLKHNIFGSSTTLSSATGTEGDEFDDHINVVLRVRPLNTQEHNRRDTFAVSFPGAGRIECDSGTNTRQFAFNVVFEPEATQMDLFEHSGVKKLIDMALNGYACTALAFGQTGSGKTHTMTGPPQQFEGGKHPPQEMVGIMQRSFDYMFSQLQQNSSSKLIRASYLEIYNEQVIDLLNPIQRRYLNVRWSKNKGFYVENLFVMECENTDDLTAVLEEGMRNRQTGSHDLNQTSSRSHTMLTLTIDSEQQDPEDENLYITKRGKLTFVDLAGSEKVKDSNSTAETLIESNNINRSLLVLGNCISSLGDPKKRQGHIPYRDSKLTKLLADSLGGNGVTLMIACITPSSHHASETMNTLRYASRAKKIRTKPIVKMDPREKLIISLKREIKMLKNENMYLRQQLEFPPSKRGPIPKNSNDEKLKNILKDKKEDVQGKEEGGLYEMLQEYMIENEALRSENADLQVVRDKMKRDQQLLYRDNEKMMQRIDDLERLMGQSPWARNTAYPDYNNPDRRASPGIRSPQGSQTWNNAPNRHPQGNYAGNVSPNGVGRGKGPPANYGQPKRPPHHLPDAIPKQGKGHPADSMNGVGPHADPRYQPSDPRYSAVLPTGNPQSIRQESPLRIDRKASQISTTDSVRSMNEKLRLELAELEGEIKEQQMMNQRTRNSYGSQTSVRSHPR